MGYPRTFATTFFLAHSSLTIQDKEYRAIQGGLIGIDPKTFVNLVRICCLANNIINWDAMMQDEWVPKLPANIVERVTQNDGEVSARVKASKENKLKAYLNMTNDKFMSVFAKKGYGRSAP